MQPSTPAIVRFPAPRRYRFRLIAIVSPVEHQTAEMDETRKRRALHGSLCTTYARFQFPTAMVAEHATAPLA
jgi:hypothetical protein